MLVANRVFDEERLVLFHRLAAAQRVVEIEPLMEVDAPVAVGTDAFARLSALLRDAPDHRSRVEDVSDRHVGGAHAERADPQWGD
jgi:hypothetical protein